MATVAPEQSAPALDAVARLYREALASVGSLTQWSLDGIDRLGVPVESTTWVGPPRHGGRPAVSHGVGYGATRSAATVGALGETAEEVVLGAALADLPRRTDSYADLLAEVGAAGVADPLTLTLPAGSDYAPNRPITWVPTVRWSTGESVWAPIEFVAPDRSMWPAGGPAALITPITNGLGAGDSIERAVGHALLEIVQRDGDTVSFRALDEGVVIDLAGLTDPTARRTVEQLRDAGVEPVVKLAATEFACVVYAVGRDAGIDPPALAASAVGEAAHPDGQTAVTKALLEYASSRARRAVSFGPIDAVRAAMPDYLAHELTLPAGGDEPRALTAMREWVSLDPEDLRALVEPILLRETSRVSVPDLPAVDPNRTATPRDLLHTMHDRLAGFDILVAAGRIGAVHAAKVLVPGLEVETLSYSRIGERVLQRLLDRGSPLVGLGDADRSSRLPVRLTAEAQERIGGPAWLDQDVVSATLGRLYPLYREPTRHALHR